MKLERIAAPGKTTQEDLEEVAALKNSRRAISRLLREKKEGVFRCLQRGGEVEPGVHTAEITEIFKGGKRIQKLKVR